MSEATTAIRPEGPADHDEIRRVVATSFGSDVEAALVDRIRSSPEYVGAMALVAEVAGRIVGHVMISGALLRGDDGGERTISMLSPLAVLPEHQGAGIGSALVRAALEIAERRGEPLVVLEGSPRVYGRLGFEPSTAHGIELPLPDWAPPEAGQVARLSRFDPEDPSLRGRVVYPAAFDELP